MKEHDNSPATQADLVVRGKGQGLSALIHTGQCGESIGAQESSLTPHPSPLTPHPYHPYHAGRMMSVMPSK
jgi:hypothetical protein